MWFYPLFIVVLSATGFFVYKAITAESALRCVSNCRVALIGDSITAHGGYASYLVSRLPNFTFTNFAIVGIGIARMRNIWQQNSVAGFDYAIVLGGANDLDRGSAYVISQLSSLTGEISATGTQVILCTLTPYRRFASTINEVNNAIKSSGRSWGASRIVDLHDPLVASDGISLRSDLIGDQMGLHPNSAGQSLMGQAIYNSAF